jgi:hypothetical protein
MIYDHTDGWYDLDIANILCHLIGDKFRISSYSKSSELKSAIGKYIDNELRHLFITEYHNICHEIEELILVDFDMEKHDSVSEKIDIWKTTCEIYKIHTAIKEFLKLQ